MVGTVIIAKQFLFLNATATTEIYTLSLHDALPICGRATLTADPSAFGPPVSSGKPEARRRRRSEEHTSELQSRRELVCRLLLEKKNTKEAISQGPIAPIDQAATRDNYTTTPA